MKDIPAGIALSADGSRILAKGTAIPISNVQAVHVGLSSGNAGLLLVVVLAAMAPLYSLFVVLISSRSLVWIYLTGISLVVIVLCLKLISSAVERPSCVYVIRSWGIYKVGPFEEYKETESAATAIAELVANQGARRPRHLSDEPSLYFVETVLVGNSFTLNGALQLVINKKPTLSNVYSVTLSSKMSETQLLSWGLILGIASALAVLPFVVLAVSGALTPDAITVLALASGLVMLLGYVVQQIFVPIIYRVTIQAESGARSVYKTTYKHQAKDVISQIKLRMEREEHETRTITIKRRARGR
jgi:hypothetical protein